MSNTPYYILGLMAAVVLIATGKRVVDREKNNGMKQNQYYMDEAMKLGRIIPRGYRNNNPLNIRISSNNWQGKVTPNTDGSFEQFTTMPYGFRAAFALIRTYINKYGCNTIRKIINRWAPPSENDTSSYINLVSDWSGMPADQTITANDANALIPIVYAMARVENGYYPLMTDVKAGWNLI